MNSFRGRGLRAAGFVRREHHYALDHSAGDDGHFHLRREVRGGAGCQTEVVHHWQAALRELKGEQDGELRADVSFPLRGEVTIEEVGEGRIGSEGGGVGLEGGGGKDTESDVEGVGVGGWRGDANGNSVHAFEKEGGGKCRCGPRIGGLM